MQIGPKHKVACHFPGDIGAHPTQPITTDLLAVDAQGNTDPSGTVNEQTVTGPGYADTWYDLKTKSFGRG